jgi:general secretion pathway protein G
MSPPRSIFKGFTLIELLVVMVIISILLTIAVPRYFQGVNKSREVILRQDLETMRDAIDKFRGDTGHFPGTLDELVSRKYLSIIPLDPYTDKTTTWVVIAPELAAETGVYNVKSGAPGIAADGTRYGEL